MTTTLLMQVIAEALPQFDQDLKGFAYFDDYQRLVLKVRDLDFVIHRETVDSRSDYQTRSVVIRLYADGHINCVLEHFSTFRSTSRTIYSNNISNPEFNLEELIETVARELTKPSSDE